MIRDLTVGLFGLLVAAVGALVCTLAPVAPWAAVLLGGPLVIGGCAMAIWTVGR